MQRRSCSGDSSGRKRRSRRSFLARRRGEAVSGTACVTPAWPRQRSDAVGNGRGGEGKQQLVGKGGGKISRRRQGGRRWRPYPLGDVAAWGGEQVRRGRRGACALGRLNRRGGGKTTRGGGRCWAAGPIRPAGPRPLGSRGGFLSFCFLFTFYLFFFSVLFLVSLLFCFSKIPKWHLICCYQICHNHKKFHPKII